MDTTLADPLIGQLLDGRYRIERRIARGGMATVYTALDVRLDRTVAIKLMHPALADDQDFVGRFHREAKAAARLSHPNVVAVFDQGEDAGRVFLVMEYVEGGTLRDLLRERGRLGAALALSVLEPVLAALDAAHRSGLVHRDVKPENVLLADDGRVKVADFGLARAVVPSTLTATTGVLIGTVAYLAPEQVSGGPADTRSDVYAAGILLVEMLTGSPPYAGDSPLSVAYRHVHEDVPAPSAAVAGIAPGIDALALRATRRAPSARPADAGAFLAELRRTRRDLGLPVTELGPRTSADDHPTLITRLPVSGARSGPHTTAPQPALPASAGAEPGGPPPSGPDSRARRSRRGPVLWLVLILLALLAAVGGWWLGSGRYTSAPGVLDLDRSTASARLAKAGLTLTVAPAGPKDFSETLAPGLVLRQRPGPGGSVRRHGTVTVALSRGPERYLVPDLAGRTPDEAGQALRDLHLRRGTATEAYDDTIARGLVVRTDPAGGTSLRPDTGVNLVLSKGVQPVPVPDVTKQPVEAAKALLAKAGLTGSVQEAFDDAVPKGAVVASNPPPGTTVDKGSAVALTVSKGPDVVAVPDVTGKSVAEATGMLQAAGLQARLVTLLPDGPGSVLRQDPGRAKVVKRGSTVTLFVF